MRTSFCQHCGNLILPGQTRCSECGWSLDGTSGPVRPVGPGPKVVAHVNTDAPFMPYEPRPEQLQIISDIRSALDQGRHIVIESGTGTGKTIVSLAGALEHARPRNKKIIYLTRTISQSDQVMKELRAISQLQPVSGITLTGRSKSCPLLMARPDFDRLSPNALSTICSDRKARSVRHESGGCPYYEQAQAQLGDIEQFCRTRFPRSDEFDAYCKGRSVCPYEARKTIMKDFDVVVAPYIHIISNDIRETFLTNLGLEPSGLVLIVDEAHNLMDAVREQESFTITTRLVMSALDECQAFRQPEVTAGVTLDNLIRAVRAAMRELATKYVGFGKKEAELPARALEEVITQRLGINTIGLDGAVERMIELGEKRAEAIADSDSPSSPVLELAQLLKLWTYSSQDRYVRAVRTGDDGEFLTASCIDPADIVKFMQALPGAVHMSGTLQPLDQYAKVMGLPRNAIPRTYPSPFPAANRKVIYAKNVTTNYRDLHDNPDMQPRLERMVAELCNTVDKNTLVFFPSYRLMRDFRPYLEDAVHKALFWEEGGGRQRQTMKSLDTFRRGREGVFCCVMGGSVAEGMDFPGDELCFAVIVGIPYPPPTLELKAMKNLYDAKYGPGMGWRYTSEVPAVRKMRQAIGRLIRTETDRGMAVILDNRAARDARQLEAQPSDDPIAEAVAFFHGS
ncbi:MAG: helicase C-terminal domain-containing protein [Methanomethylophilus sp.]